MIRRWIAPSLLSLGLLLYLVGCGTPAPPPQVKTVLRPEKLAEMDRAIERAIAEKRLPGGVLWFEHAGASYHRAYGNRALVPSVEPMTEDTIFDAASLTKVVACAPAVMLLIERGKLKLDDLVQTYIPDFKGGRQRNDHNPPTSHPHIRPAR